MELINIRDNVRLITRLDTNSVSNTELDTIINQGYHELSTAFPWPWLETTADFTVGVDVRNYALPTNFDYGIAMIDTNSDRAIQFISAKEFFSLYGQDTSSLGGVSTTGTRANFYTIFANEVYFTPVPSTQTTAAYTFYYYANITILVGSNDIPAFHDGFHWMLVEYAKWKLWSREEYSQLASEAFATYAFYLTEMIKWYGRSVKMSPFIWGDGRTVRPFNNLKILDI